MTRASMPAQLQAPVERALAQWRAAADRDRRVRYGSAFAVGLVIGRVVRRAGR